MLNLLIPLTQGFPRFVRYSVGNRMVDIGMDMVMLIYRANSSYDKLPVLLELQDKYRMLQMLFRLSVEQRVISERQYARHALLLDQIGRQITGWRQFAEKRAAEKRDVR